jgi:putative nucleotidyltransferase with HDIG domain
VYLVSFVALELVFQGNVNETIWRDMGVFGINGLLILALSVPLFYVYEKVFGLVSDYSLLELSDTNTDLLKEMADKAPGTFHHSLQVANLAEAAAQEVGANAMLVRVGALYHDIGKMLNPIYFTENQISGSNLHDELSNLESVKIIIDHVKDGVALAKKNKLPDRIIDFIRTHHGTSLVYYFYQKEKEQSEFVDEMQFRYPGPIPFSKETAILMMADSVEAASKSLKEPTALIIDDFVEKIITKQLEEAQFVNADISLKEIEQIKKVLKRKLINIYHLRVEYPE